MTSDSYEPDEVLTARNKLAGLRAYGHTPDPEVEADAYRALQVAKLDRAIREATTVSPPLKPTQMGHLIGLLLSWGGSDEGAAERLERAVREAIYVTTGLTTEDRERIAAIIATGTGAR